MKMKLLITSLVMSLLFLFPCSANAAIAKRDALDSNHDTLFVSYLCVAKNEVFHITSIRISTSMENVQDVMINGTHYPLEENVEGTERVADLKENQSMEISGNQEGYAFDEENSYVAQKINDNELQLYGFREIADWTPGAYGDLEDGTTSSYGKQYELLPIKTVAISQETPDEPEEPEKPEETIKPVAPEIPNVQSISLSGPSKMNFNSSVQLSINTKPSVCTVKKLTLTSSNSKYATVTNNGLVKAKKAGAGKTVTITANADGKKSTHKIKINGIVKKITITGKSSVKAGKKLQLKAALKTKGKNANKKVTWKVSNKKYATISSKGLLKTKAAGKGHSVKVTAMATDGSKVKGTKTIKIK